MRSPGPSALSCLAAALALPAAAQDQPTEFAGFARPPDFVAAPTRESLWRRPLPSEGFAPRLPRPADQPLIDAARAADWPRVLELLRNRDLNVDVRDERGFSALALAARAGAEAVVRELIRRGADVERVGEAGLSPLASAILGGHGQTVRLLVRAGADPYARGGAPQPPLHWAGQLGQTDAIAALLALGVDPERPNERNQTPLYTTLLAKRWDALDMLSQAVAQRRRQRPG